MDTQPCSPPSISWFTSVSKKKREVESANALPLIGGRRTLVTVNRKVLYSSNGMFFVIGKESWGVWGVKTNKQKYWYGRYERNEIQNLTKKRGGKHKKKEKEKNRNLWLCLLHRE